MIIRHIPMKCARKSSFEELVRYLTNPQGKEERVGLVHANNCQNTEREWAIQEILATQAMNQRATGDKNFHLLISFAKGEYPTESMLRDMEARIVASVGLGDHQRISIVHHDTDNLHVHVAINKIHPLTHTLHEPYRAYRKFGDIASQLEVEYGLQPTCHTARKTRSQNHADDMEHHAGVESLMGFIKRECQVHLEQAQSWGALHQILQRHRLAIRARGNGFVITNGDSLAVKASSVSRELSKNRLEQRLGTFRPMLPEEGTTQDEIRYRKRPLAPNTSELYARYCTIQKRNQHALKQALDLARRRRRIRIAAIQQKNRLQRAAIKLLKGRENKKVLHTLAYKRLQTHMEQIRTRYVKERQEIYQKYQRHTWLDWLQQQATHGNREALQALRGRKVAPVKRANTLGGMAAEKHAPYRGAKRDNVTKQGTEILHKNRATIRDDGTCIAISQGISAEGLKSAILKAREKFGSRLRITGTDAFREAILQTAAHFHLPITFEDATLEARRKQLISQSNHQENPHARTRRNHQNAGTRILRKPARSQFQRHPRHPGILESNPFCIGHLPPTQSQNRLRILSELHVVQLTRGSKMLLPDHAHHQLERKGGESCHRM